MITWHTRFSFGRTAQDLERVTLGYQIEQAFDVFVALTTEAETDVPDTHPVLRMWEGYEIALAAYGMELGLEFTVGRHMAEDRFWQFSAGVKAFKKSMNETYLAPPWKDDADVCRSHRSNLMRRQPGVYGDTWPRTPELMPYLWPFVDEDGGYDLMVSKTEQDLLRQGKRKLPPSIKSRVANL